MASLDTIASIQQGALQQLTLLNKNFATVFPRSTGTITLAASVTTTTVTNSAMTTASKVFVEATNTAARTLGAHAVTTKAAGSFVLTTASSAGGESYDYFIVNSV